MALKKGYIWVTKTVQKTQLENILNMIGSIDN